MHRNAPGPTLPFGVRRYRDDAAALMLGLHREYGDVARFRVGPQLMHQIAGPDLIRQVLHDRESYRRGAVYGGFELFFGQGMLTTEGAHWRTRRSAGQPYFHAHHLHPAVPDIAEVVGELLERWEILAAQGVPVDIVPGIMRLTFEVVTTVLCGTDMRHRSDEVVAAIPYVLSAMFPGSPEQLLPSWLPGRVRRRLRSTQSLLDGVADELMDRFLDGAAPPDRLVGTLFGTTDPVTDAPLTRRQIADELKTYLLAGHETTGCGLTWTLYEIARHPAVHDRLTAELTEVLGDRSPTAADLPHLPYLSQVVDEALRLHPPIPMFPREPLHDIELGGYRIPGGTAIFVSPHAAHRDPRHWTDPDTFDPDRFGPDRPKPQPYTYLPFGGGARRCIGAPLAEFEIRIAVALIVRRFRLTPPPGRNASEYSLVSLRPRAGLPLTITHAQHSLRSPLDA